MQHNAVPALFSLKFARNTAVRLSVSSICHAAEVKRTASPSPSFVPGEEESASFELFQTDHRFTGSSSPAAVCAASAPPFDAGYFAFSVLSPDPLKAHLHQDSLSPLQIGTALTIWASH